jgi:NAD(P)-dependent dehydrogenase (short-subunit alcohol dehydrogenase family)
MPDFRDAVVLVSGAAGNLGSVVARAFHACGARLAVTDRNPSKLAMAWGPTVDGIFTCPCNLGDPAEVVALAGETVERFGRIDVLVNVAGGFAGGTPLHETAPETWSAMLDGNARSVFHLARAVVPRMLAQGAGKIVNVASRAALAGLPEAGPYSAAKAAVVRLTESMAAELKGRGINVNCILPGTIDTAANRAAQPHADAGQWVKPEALADVVLFLASERARAIHGAAIPVYGLG